MVSKVFHLTRLERLRLLPHLVLDVLLPLVVLVLAAGLQVELVDAPELQVIGESQNAHLLHQVELSRPVEVEDGREGPRVPVEEVLVVHEVVVVAQLHEGVVAVALPEAAQSGVRQVFQSPPQNFVLRAADVQDHPTVHRLAAHDHEVVGGIRTRDLAFAEKGRPGSEVGRPRGAAPAVHLYRVRVVVPSNRTPGRVDRRHVPGRRVLAGRRIVRAGGLSGLRRGRTRRRRRRSRRLSIFLGRHAVGFLLLRRNLEIITNGGSDPSPDDRIGIGIDPLDKSFRGARF